MSVIIGIIVVLLVVWMMFHTLSYAWWNWKNKNRTGSVLLAILSIAAAIMPCYMLFFKT